MKVPSVNIFISIILPVFILVISAKGYSKEPERGVAVEPMKIIAQDHRLSYFTVYNDTDNEYFITARVVKADGDVVGAFAFNPPVCHLNKREDVRIALIYLPDNKSKIKEKLYYLSISFIPLQHESIRKADMPLVLVQQIPISIE